MQKILPAIIFLWACVPLLAQQTGLIVQAGHTGRINSIQYSPDGALLLTCGDDGARLWEARSGRLLHFLKGHNGSVQTAVFSYDGKYVLTGGTDSAAAVWNTESGLKKHRYIGFKFWPELIVPNPVNNTAFLSEGKTGQLVNLETGRVILKINSYSYITNAVFNLNGTALITEGWRQDSAGNNLSSIDAWDAFSGALLSSHDNTPEETLSDIRFIAGNNRFAAWLSTGENRYKLAVYSGLPGNSELNAVSKTIYDPPGDFTVSSNGKTAINVPYLENFFMAFEIGDSVSMYKKEVPGLSQAIIDKPGGIIHTLYTLDEDTSLIIWEAKTGRTLKTISLPADIIALSPDGNYVAAVNWSEVSVISLKTGRLMYSLKGKGTSAFAAVFDPVNAILYSAQADDFVRGWDIKNASRHITSVEEEGRIKFIAISPDGSEIAFTGAGGFLGVQNTNTGEEFAFMAPDFCSRFSSVAFHPSRRKLVAAACNQLDVIDMDSFPLYFNLFSPYLNDQFTYACFNPAGDKITAMNLTGDLFVWDIATKKEETRLPNYFHRPVNFRYTADGKNILLVCKDTAVKVLSTKDYAIQYIFRGFTDLLYRAETNPKNTLLLVGDGDSLKMMRFPSGEKVYSVYTGGKLLTTDWANNKMAVERDEQLLVYDIEAGKELYSIIAFEKDEYLFILPNGKYKSTKNAAANVGWLRGLKRYDFDQFDLLNNRPDLVLKALGNTDTLLQDAYYNAWRKRVKRAGFSPENLLANYSVPGLDILGEDELPMETSAKEITIKISAADSLYSLKQLNVWINGVPVFGYKGKPITGKVFDGSLKIALSEGKNKIQFSVINEKGGESFRPSVSVVYNPPVPAKPRTWFIGFGVNNYKDDRYTLNYSVKDIQDLAGWFSKFPGTVLDTFTDARVTRENILSIKKKLLKTRPEDRVIISFSGHGLLDDSLNFYYATRDIDFKNPAGRGVLYEEIERLLDSIPARKKLLLMDACHSGESDREEMEPFGHMENGTQADSGQLMITRFGSRGMELLEDSAGAGVGLQNSFELMQDLFADVSRGTGSRIISAAAGDSYAYEKNDLENGVFTWCVLNGLKNKAADYNGDGKITVVELEKYVKTTVEEITVGKQKPTSRSGLVEYDWEF